MLFVWAAVLFSLNAFLSSEGGQAWIRRRLVALLAGALDTDVELGAVRLSGIAHVSLEGLVIYDKACQPFLRVEALELAWYPSAFWRGFWAGRLRVPVSALTLRAPQVYIYTERVSGLTNVDRLFASSDTASDKPGRWEISLGSVEIHDGRFQWVDSTNDDQALRPRPGFVRYENLLIDSLHLEAGVEWQSRGYLFLQVAELGFHERHADFHVPHLALVVQAYPDKVILPHLRIHLPRSNLTGRGQFLREGLDKLFSDTETKLFLAELKGHLDWAEIAALAGDSLPLQGGWDVNLRVLGDLYRFRAEALEVRLPSGAYLAGKGEIVHYAHPEKMHWDFSIHEAVLSLSDLQATLPDVGPLPDFIRMDHFWRFRGEHTGRLHHYTADLTTEGMTARFLMTRDTIWRYELALALDRWRPGTLTTDSLIQVLSGSLELRGQGFSVESLLAEVRANLTADDRQHRLWRLETISHVEKGAVQGTHFVQTPFGVLWYEGQVPLALTGDYHGKGKLSQVTAQAWGSEGFLSGSFTVEGRGVPWETGTASLSLEELQWRRRDTIHRLGALSLAIEHGSTFTVQGEGVALRWLGEGDWSRYLPLWVERWLRADTTPSDTLWGSWAINARMLVSDPSWGRLLGLPPALALYEFRFYMDLRADSSVPSGSAHLSLDTLKWESFPFIAPHLTLYIRGDSIQMDLGSTQGRAYLAYEVLRGHLEGDWNKGKGVMETFLSGYQDTVALYFEWAHTPQALQIGIKPESSFLMLGGYRWRFLESSPLLIDLEAGDWQLAALRMEGGPAQVSVSRTPQKLTVSIYRFPVSAGVALAGYSAPVSGEISLLWEVSDGGPRFALEVDSLVYEGQSYPRIQVAGEPDGDSIPFRLALWQGNTSFVQAQGVYALPDTVSPLYLELRSLRVPAQWFSPFLGEYIQNPRGTLLAQRLVVRGKPDSPRLFGEVFCDNISFYMPITRVIYTVEGVLRLRGDSILFPNVELRESRAKRGYINGYIALRGWTSPYLQLSAQVRDKPFLLAASAASSDAYLYGRAELERGSFTIVGPWDQPSIRGEAVFSGSTDLTLPLRIYERSTGADHVTFLKAADTMESIPQLAAPAGVDVRVAISSVPEARFRLLFDERTGDEITAQGTANLLFTINRTGQTGLAGSYELQSGEYRVNLQGVASKRLFLEPGSRITWDGDLYQGRMDIVATYRTFTSLRMVDTSFTYTLPVEVRVFLRGTLLSPVMSFQVEIPSLSGTPTPLVNLFLQRLATDEQERSRQVFALLVLGTFVPLEQGFGTQQVSSGVSSTLAEFLSAQLASWVGYTLGSQVGVAFSLGEWNELSARLRLSLGQRFTLERDGVLVGPGQNAAALGNLSARYRLLPKRLTQPTQWQLEVEGFNRQTFMWGAAGATSQGAGIRLRKSFYPPERRRKSRSTQASEEVPAETP